MFFSFNFGIFIILFGDFDCSILIYRSMKLEDLIFSNFSFENRLFFFRFGNAIKSNNHLVDVINFS